MEIPYIVEERSDTGLNNVKLGIWLFLASEVMLFGALFSSYVLLRLMATEWPFGVDVLNVPLGTVNTAVLIGSSVTMVMAYASLKMDDFGRFRFWLAFTIVLSLVFMVIKGFEYNHEFEIGNFPWTSTYLAIYYTMTGLHALHIIGGVVVNYVSPAAGLEDVEDEQGAVHEPDRGGRPLLALRRPGVDLPVPGALPAVG